MLNVQLIPVERLKANQKNPRVINGEAFKRLCASLKEDPAYFEARPILANKDMVIFAGNQRFRAALEIGMKEVPVIVMDNPDLEAKRMLRDNISAGDWDMEILANDFDTDFLREVGFSDDALGELAQETALLNEEVLDEVPAKLEEAITKPGDLWLLGNHRLLCGDSSKPTDVDKLLDGTKIQLVNTDPPYNVNVAPRSNNAVNAALASGNLIGQQGMDVANHPQVFVRGRDMAKMKKNANSAPKVLRAKDRPLANDFLDDEAFAKLLLAWFGNITRVLEPGRCFYIWGGYSNIDNYPNVLKACELYFSQMIIWVKEHPVLTRKDFMGNHEWCFYGWKEGAGHKFYGPNNATDVWSVKKVNPQSMVHLTEKPVELAVRAINYSSLKGENVLDLFGGSGSTLIACEHTARKAFLMELDPLYCDVIVKRWEQVTGKKAEVRHAV